MEKEKLIELMKSEMKPSTGCTEPAAIGLAAARTARLLGAEPDGLSIRLSPGIFKNAFGVKIPNAGCAGIELAASLGALLKDEPDNMEIFSLVSPDILDRAKKMVESGFVQLDVNEGEKRFYIGVEAVGGENTASTVTMDSHDNMVKAVKNGGLIYDRSQPEIKTGDKPDFDIRTLDISHIIDICENINIDELDFIAEAVDMNLAVSNMGKEGDFGLNIGRSIERLEKKGFIKEDIVSYAKKTTAFACDCRMGGGNIATMTVLGSGNQGIEATLPVAAAAKYLGLSRDKMLRAVAISIAVTIYIKYHVGRLSPVCGAVLSGSGSSCAIAWLMGASREQMKGAVQNMFGNLSGMVCDGAKDGCALKLAVCAGEAALSAALALDGVVIKETDGIISKNLEASVKNMSELSNTGMACMDSTLISIMINKE